MSKKWFVFALLVASAGCKQGIGERCETSDDCASGVCSSSSPKTCVKEDTSMDPIDATLPPESGP